MQIPDSPAAVTSLSFLVRAQHLGKPLTKPCGIVGKVEQEQRKSEDLPDPWGAHPIISATLVG